MYTVIAIKVVETNYSYIHVYRTRDYIIICVRVRASCGTD